MRSAASSAAPALSGVAGGVDGLMTSTPGPRRSGDRCWKRRQLAAQLDHGVTKHRFGQRGDPNLRRDLLEKIGILAQEIAHVLATLPETHVAIREPGAALVDDVGVDAHVEHAAGVRDALVVQDVELGRAERRGDLVLDNFDFDTAADDVEALLDGVD